MFLFTGIAEGRRFFKANSAEKPENIQINRNGYELTLRRWRAARMAGGVLIPTVPGVEPLTGPAEGRMEKSEGTEGLTDPS